MAIWQWRLILIPEKALLKKFEVLPLAIAQELAEDFPWWSETQPRSGFEKKIDSILPQMDSWSTSMRMWGQKDGNDAYVCYTDESKNKTEEVAFRIDARDLSQELVRGICALATDLDCMLMTSEYELLAPDEATVLRALSDSTAKKFTDDPVSTLRSLSRPEVQEQLNYPAKSFESRPPKKD
jgi:hypothetical protein